MMWSLIFVGVNGQYLLLRHDKSSCRCSAKGFGGHWTSVRGQLFEVHLVTRSRAAPTKSLCEPRVAPKSVWVRAKNRKHGRFATSTTSSRDSDMTLKSTSPRKVNSGRRVRLDSGMTNSRAFFLPATTAGT